MQTGPDDCETIASTRCPSACTDGNLDNSHSVTQTGHFVYPSPTDHKQIGGSRLNQLGVEARTLAPATRLKDLPRTKRPVIATVRSVSEDTQDDRERLTELINAGIIPGAQISITATADSIEVRGLNTMVLSPRRSHSIQIDLSPTAATS